MLIHRLQLVGGDFKRSGVLRRANVTPASQYFGLLSIQAPADSLTLAADVAYYDASTTLHTSCLQSCPPRQPANWLGERSWLKPHPLVYVCCLERSFF